MPLTQYAIHLAAERGDMNLLTEMLDRGVDVDLPHHAKMSTPLFFAADHGSRPAMELLVDRGADVNKQCFKNQVPLHRLVLSRLDADALWLMRMGADHTIEDSMGFSARDYAQDFVQLEMDKVAVEVLPTGFIPRNIDPTLAADPHRPFDPKNNIRAGVAAPLGAKVYAPYELNAVQRPTGIVPAPTNPHAKGAAAVAARKISGSASAAPGVASNEVVSRKLSGDPSPVSSSPPASSAVPTAAPAGPIRKEVVKVYLENSSYKTVMISSDMRASDLTARMCEKLGMADYISDFVIMNYSRGTERMLGPHENLFAVKSTWIKVVGKNNEDLTDMHYHFLLSPKTAIGPAAKQKYRATVNMDK